MSRAISSVAELAAICINFSEDCGTGMNGSSGKINLNGEIAMNAMAFCAGEGSVAFELPAIIAP